MINTSNSLFFKKKVTEKPTPPINKDCAILSLDSLGVLDGLPWKLGERLSQDHASTFLLAESILLTVRSVPHPVNEKIHSVETGEGISVPLVGRWVVVCEIDGAVAVAQGHTSQIPEDEHKSPFLEVHIPRKELTPLFPFFRNEGVSYHVVIIHSSPFEQALAYKK